MSQPDFERLLEWSDEDVDIAELTELKGGRSSAVFATNHHVVKIQRKRFRTDGEAHRYADELYGEQERITDYMGEKHVASARFLVGEEARGVYRVALLQRRISGITLAASVNTDPLSLSPVVTYLETGLCMYSQTGEIPDLACVENDFFNPLIDQNTKVVSGPQGAVPVLVDTTYGRAQRLKYVGPIVHAGIARGVTRALDTLHV